jgi:diguanylate cyclase (GGDEF)-like protein
MNVPKLRAALVVFFVGFALGVSVFAASRLFVRSVLTSDARSAVEDLAERIGAGDEIEPTGNLGAIARYSYFRPDGSLVETRRFDDATETKDTTGEREIRTAARQAANGEIVVTQAPLAASLLGLTEPNVKGVAAPVLRDGKLLGTLYVEIDQRSAMSSLTRAFSVVGMVAVGLAVLAVIALLAAMRALADDRRTFHRSSLTRDSLTTLLTRRGFEAALAEAVHRATELDAQVGLLIVDIDQFRTVNDVWGHSVGDQVLKTAAERLRSFAAVPAALARISGDNFALIVEPDATSHSLRSLADRIRAALGEPYQIGESSIALGASIGAAIYPVNADSAQNLFRAADTALSKAKLEGRNALSFFDTEMKQRMERHAILERDLRQALGRGEFVVFYQPQLDLSSGRLRGHEALVRWERPGEAILSPREFLPVAEETGLIRPLGDWVLRKACEDAATWLESGTVAVNFSAAQFRFQDLDKNILKVLSETGLPPERLEIEVPERLFLDRAPEVMETLKRIKALGVRVAMDGFGAGYTGLASLAHFPFDKIKIDRSFVSQLTEDADVASIVASIVGLGRSLSVDITAEGVETNEQVVLLKAAGCSIAQGFLFGVPQRDGAMSSGTAAPASGAGSPAFRAG